MALDVRWLRAGGGIVGHRHPPARRFNAGQKMIYGVVVLVGSTMAASGYILKFPCYLTDISQMQTPELVHAVASEHLHRNDRDGGTFEAMVNGGTDENWSARAPQPMA